VTCRRLPDVYAAGRLDPAAFRPVLRPRVMAGRNTGCAAVR